MLENETVGSNSGDSENSRGGRARQRGPLVGRDSELSSLLEILADPASRDSAVLLVSGEPGVGKSRLVFEAGERAAAAGWHVLVGHAYDSEGMPPYLPFVEALSSYVRGMAPDDLMRRLGDDADQIALLLPEVRRVLPGEAGGPVQDPESSRYNLFESVSDFLLAIARSAPSGLLLCLDDLHWADGSTLLLLEHLIRRIAGEPLVILTAYRETELDVSRPLARTLEQLTRQRLARRISVRRLSREDVRTLLAALGRPGPPDAVVDAVFRETEGNPFFVHEVFEYLAEEGRLFGQSGEWRTDLQLSEYDVPQGVRLVIGRRLEHLSQPCRRMLASAAMLGRSFSFELLQAVTELQEDALLDVLDEATTAGLVSSGGQGQSFTHELIRQTLLADLSLPRRQRHSLRVANALVKLYGDEDPQHLNDIVAHYRQAGAAANPAEAIGYFVKAGRAAADVFAWEDAADHYRAALDMLETTAERDDALEVDLLQALMAVLMPSGTPKPILEQVAPRAYALAESLGDEERMGAVARAATDAGYREWGPLGIGSPDGRQWLARADRHTAEGSPGRLLVNSRKSMALRVDSSPEYWPFTMQTYAEALASGNVATILDTAAFGPLVLGAPAIQGVGDLKRVFEEVRDLPRMDIPIRTRGNFLRDLIDAGLTSGDRAAYDAGLDELGEVVQRLNDTFISEELWNGRINQLFLDGRLSEALDLFHGRMRAEPLPAEYSRLFAIATCVRILLLRGETDEARSIMREIPAYYQTRVPPAWRTIAAFFLASLGETETAAQRMNDWLQTHRLSEICLTNEINGALHAALVLGDPDTIRRVAEPMKELAGLPVCGWQAYAAPGRLLAEAALVEGDYAGARAFLETALAAVRRIRFRPEVALCSLGLAEILARHYPNDRNAAAKHLEFALLELEAMDMQPALVRARQLQDGLAGNLDRSPHPMGLSDRQLEVLRLAAAGKSNQEIADALVLSVRTVERHIADCYAKIGARNRVEATAFALTHLMETKT